MNDTVTGGTGFSMLAPRLTLGQQVPGGVPITINRVFPKATQPRAWVPEKSSAHWTV
jgi:hypothetical protein